MALIQLQAGGGRYTYYALLNVGVVELVRRQRR